jgi:crossover junction endodeoxyribonuclease RusA
LGGWIRSLLHRYSHHRDLGSMTTTTSVEFFVPGKPVAQGSKRHIGGGRMIEQNPGLGAWRDRIAIIAHNNMMGRAPFTGPMCVELRFRLPRPKSAPKSFAPASKRPDLDKLVRSCFDAITNVILCDDAQVVELHARKRLTEPGETPGVRIHIEGINQ